jgi:hypothetical protein
MFFLNVGKKPLYKNTVILYENTVILDKNTVFGLVPPYKKTPPSKILDPYFFRGHPLWKS